MRRAVLGRTARGQCAGRCDASMRCVDARTYERTYVRRPWWLRKMTKPVESDARAGVPSGVLAKREPCRYCRAGIVLAVCRDGRWRTFDPQQVPAAAANVWAWRRR